jgi:glycosyltransferase involved in cell wall biosynthesis
MERLRIAQVAPLYESVPPKLYGGTERVVSFLTEELVAQGHQVTLFASGDSVTKARLVPACEHALRLNKSCIDQLANHITMLQMLQDEIADFDIIHYHIDYLHFPLSRLNPVAHITTLHGRLNIPDLSRLYTKFGDLPVVSISKAQRKPLMWLNWVGNIYHGLPHDLFKPSFTQGKYLAFLGRISPEKRVDRAIEIAIKCGLPLKIAAKIDHGDQRYYETRIKKLMRHPLIDFIGEINENEKEKFLSEAIALIFPIDWAEPFGLVMIEAMACGTPVVAYRNGSVEEIIGHGQNGFIVETQEDAVKAVQNISLIDRQECRNVFERKFTADRMATGYLKVYQQRIGIKGRVKNIKSMQL